MIPIRKEGRCTHAVAMIAATGIMVIIPILAHGATALVTVTATVVKNLSVETQSSLAFGALDTSASQGTIVLDSNGTRSATGGARVEAGGSTSPAALVIHGAPDAAISLSTGPSDELTDDRGDVMTVDHFEESTGAVTELNRSGTRTIKLGATLHVNANQALGAYAGTMQVTVNYN